MLRTIGTVLLWAVFITVMVFAVTVVVRLTLAFLSHTRWEEKAGELGSRWARKEEQLKRSIEDRLELVD